MSDDGRHRMIDPRWSADASRILDEIGREKGLDVEAIRREARREIELWEAAGRRFWPSLDSAICNRLTSSRQNG